MKRRTQAPGTAEVERLLAQDQPGLFAAIGELDWYSGSHRRWIDDLGLRAGDRVLEVGCGTGALTAYLADMGYSATGLDRSDDMIRRARIDHPHLDFCVGDATLLSYDDNVFDAVVAASVVNIVPDAKLVVSEMHRVCAPGGTVSVLVPSTGFTDEDLDTLIETRELEGFSQAALRKWHRSAPKTSRSQLETLLDGVLTESVAIRSYLDGMLFGATTSA